MKVSCIVCHHKGNLVLKAIKSLLRQKQVTVEIIVATSVKDITFAGAKTVYIQGGPAIKRNIAFKFASHDYIAFFDDDIEALTDTVFEMAKFLENNEKTGMVFGKLLNMEFPERFDEAGSFLTPTGFLWARAESGLVDTGQFDETCEVLSGKSAACMIRRKTFVRARMFDPSYEILAEETDLAWRVRLYGESVFYVPSSVTLHAFNTKFKPKDFYTPKRVYFNGCRNYLSMLLTNLADENLLFPVVVQTVVWFLAGVGFIVTGKFKAGTNVFKGLIWVITRFKTILIKRHKVQSERVMLDSVLLPIIMRKPPMSYFINRFFHYIKTGRHG